MLLYCGQLEHDTTANRAAVSRKTAVCMEWYKVTKNHTNTSLNTVQKRIVVQANNTLQEIKTRTQKSNALQKEKWGKIQEMQRMKTRANERMLH